MNIMDNFSPNLDKTNGKPLYHQLYSYILSELKHGNIRGGERLPSKRQLAENLGISRNTVEAAYRMLISEGFIEPVERSGYYVSELDTLDYSSKSSEVSRKQEIQPPEWYYDLRTSNIATDSFPVKIWNRLYRSTLSGSEDLLNLGERQGEYELREEIAKYLYAYRGVVCSPEQIVIGAGIEYLVTLLTGILKDSTFALEDPGYPRTREILENHNIAYTFIPVDAHGMSYKELRESQADIAYLTPSHQFPTGALMPAGRRLQLLRWAAEDNRRFIIEDDYDSEFRFDRFPVSSLQGLDTKDKVIYMSTFSRSLAPGIRIAYMVLPPRLLETFKENFRFYTSTVSRFEQITLANFMKEGHYTRHLNRIKKVYRERRDHLVELLENSFGNKIEITGSHTGLHMLVSFDVDLTEKKLVERAQKNGINVSGFKQFFNRKIDNSEKPSLVLGFGNLTEEDMDKAIEKLRRAI